MRLGVQSSTNTGSIISALSGLSLLQIAAQVFAFHQPIVGGCRCRRPSCDSHVHARKILDAAGLVALPSPPLVGSLLRHASENASGAARARLYNRSAGPGRARRI
jgi:hypothetical protein